MPDEFVPEHIATILKCRTHDRAALDIVNKWFLNDLANARPDLNKFERNCWKSRLEMFERRLQQAYRNLQADDPVASSGEAIRVFRPQDTAKGRTKQFNDELEDDFDKPKNLEQLVLSVCGRESYEWQRFQKLNNLFYVPVPPSLSVVGPDGVESFAQEDEPQYDIKDEELANGILSFEPHKKQEGFCRSQARIVVALGGNGSGKTETLCRLAGWELLQGKRAGRLPVHGWCVRPSYSDDISTDPIFAKLWFGDGDNLPIIPPHFQEKLTGNPKKVMHTTLGSTLSIRTWSQGFQRQQGHSPDFVLIDEECDDVFFTELCVRMFRRAKGWIGAAITDTTAPHWALELEERFNRGDPNVYVCRMRTNDNPYISKEQVAVFSEGMDDIEKSIRLEGGLVLAGGAVYKCWSDKNWRDRSDLPLDGTDYVFIDPGISNPCAVLWVRVMKPEMRKTSSGADKLISDIWLIGEYYRRGVSDIAQHVAEIRAMNQALCSRPVKYYIDPWTGAAHVHKVGEPQVVMDVWRRAGIPVVPASSKRDMYRLERFRETEKHIKHSEIDYPNLYALRDMKYFRRELVKYVVSGLVTPRIKSSRQRSEEFSGDNHLIFGMECAVVMKPRYISEYTAETAVMTQGQILGRLAWERMDQENVPLFTSGDLGVMLEPNDVATEAATTDSSVA